MQFGTAVTALCHYRRPASEFSRPLSGPAPPLASGALVGSGLSKRVRKVRVIAVSLAAGLETDQPGRRRAIDLRGAEFLELASRTGRLREFRWPAGFDESGREVAPDSSSARRWA